MTKERLLEFYQQVTIEGKFETCRKNMDAFLPVIVGYTKRGKFKRLNKTFYNSIQKQGEVSDGITFAKITTVNFK
jgi:hypothetical protein